MQRHRYAFGIVGILALTLMAAVVSQSNSSVAVSDLGPPAEWPAFQMTYETRIQSATNEEERGIRITQLVYTNRGDWTSVVIKPAFEAAEEGSTRTFADGVFHQNFNSAGREITEKIPEGKYVAPDDWLRASQLRMLESRGFTATRLDGQHVRYEHLAEHSCDDIPAQNWPGECEPGKVLSAVETFVVRTDISGTPLPVEYKATLGKTMLEQVVVTELLRLEDGTQVVSLP